MRSRSKRLFIVLLHLVGVSTNLPRRHGSHVGIVGVHPMAILLERLELEAYDDGLDGLLKQAAEWDGVDDILSDPYWLQDDVDGKCYGPGGFSECGDATLWQLRRRPDDHGGGLLHGFRSKHRKGDNGGYALQSFNVETIAAGEDGDVDSKKGEKHTLRGRDCLVAESNGRRKRRNARDRKAIALLELGDCSSAWSWKINGMGVLYQEMEDRNHAKSMHMAQPPVFQGQRVRTSCLWRRNATAAILSPCKTEPLKEKEVIYQDKRLVSFSLVRYQTTPSSSPSSYPSVTTTAGGGSVLPTGNGVEEKETFQEHLQTTNDMAHSRSLGLAMFPELKPPQQLLFPRLGDLHRPGRGGDSSQSKKRNARTPSIALLKDSNPILFHIQEQKQHQAEDADVTPEDVEDVEEELGRRSDDTGTSVSISRPRRIPVHPYIVACENGVWTDPQTGLEYLTDISDYLGYGRKAAGRHTLMGVGQYTRTVFNIKVYGVALYVSKRDVLADPQFESYATMTADELRESWSFYSHLRNMPSRTDPTAGLFDRSIFIKLNMQISVDHMRASLEADWKKLSDVDKERLIACSLNPRPALEPMLRKIQSSENPSRCSCGQSAPEEYRADPTCCARGTELVFTWRKNGDLEVRVDRRVMDTFPSPQMAKGIFYEYLRTDDPISPDAVKRIADGFPFLLAPLAQVKGVSSPAMSSGTFDSSSHTADDSGIFHALGAMAGIFSSQSSGLADWLQRNADGMASNVVTVARSTGDSVRSFGDEMYKRRGQMWAQMASVPEHSMQFLSARVQDVAYNVKSRRDRRKGLVLVSATKEPTSNLASPDKQSPPRGRVFRSPMSQWSGEEPPLPDEIGPFVEPTMSITRRIFLFMVHLYLLLMLIVSMPGSYTRTRLRVVRKSYCGSSRASFASVEDSLMTSSSEEEDTLDNSRQLKSTERRRIGKKEAVNTRDHSARPTGAQEMKKSLSYFL